MQPKVTPLFRCDACGKGINGIKYVSAVGNVCPDCYKRYGSFGRLVDLAESMACNRADEQSVSNFRRVIRVLQVIGQKYEIRKEGDVDQIEIIEDSRRRKLILANVLKHRENIDNTLDDLGGVV